MPADHKKQPEPALPAPDVSPSANSGETGTILRLAGEIHKALWAADQEGAFPTVPEEARGPEPKLREIFQRIGVRAVDFEAAPAPGWRPEWIPQAIQEIDGRIGQAESARTRFEERLAEADQALGRILTQRHSLLERFPGLFSGTANAAPGHKVDSPADPADSEDPSPEALSEEDTGPGVLGRLKKLWRPNRTAEVLTPESDPEPIPNPDEVMKEKARQRLDLLAQREALAVRGAGEIKKRLAENTRRLERLRDIRRNLTRAAAAWERLKGYLSDWPGEAKTLGRRVSREARPDEARVDQVIGRVHQDHQVYVEKWEEASRRQKDAAGRGNRHLAATIELEARLGELGRRLDRETAALRQGAEAPDPLPQLVDLCRQAVHDWRDHKAERREIAGELKAGLDEREKRLAEGRTLKDRRRSQVESETQTLRALAVRRAGLLRLVDRRRNRVTGLVATLPRLIGGSPFVYRLLAASAWALIQAQEELDQAAHEMEAAGDRLNEAAGLWLDLDMKADPWGRDVWARLTARDPAREMIERLPRQLANLRTALSRASRIRSLETALEEKDQAGRRLSEENERLEAAIEAGREKLERLAETHQALEAARLRDREALVRVARDRTRWLREAKSASAARTRLLEEKGRLEKKVAEDHQALADLAVHRRNLEQTFFQVRTDREALLEERAKGLAELEAVRALAREREEERNQLQALRDRYKEQLTRLAEAYRQSRERLALLLDQSQRLKAWGQGRRDEALRLKDERDQKAAAYDQLDQDHRRLTEDNLRLTELRAEWERRLGVLAEENARLHAETERRQAELAGIQEEARRLEEEAALRQDEVARLTVDRNRLGVTLRERSHEVRLLSEEKARIQAELAQRNQQRQQLEAQRNDLAALRDRQARELEALAEERTALVRERDDLLEDRSRLTREKEVLTQERDTLAGEKDRLIRLVLRARRRLSTLVEEKNFLSEALSQAAGRAHELESHLNDEIGPLIQTLGMALYQDQVHLADLERMESDHRARIESMSLVLAELETGKKDAEGAAFRLGLALTLLSQDHAGDRAEWDEERTRLGSESAAWARLAEDLSRKLEALETDNQDLQGLVGRQAGEIQSQRDQLAQIVPLLSFFLEEAALWNPPASPSGSGQVVAEGSELPLALLTLLKRENDTLKEKVRRLSDDGQDLRRTNDHLARSHQAIKDHLEELRPVFASVFSAWIQTTADLAEAQADRRAAGQEVAAVRDEWTRLKSEHLRLTRRQERLMGELDETRGALETSTTQRDQMTDRARVMGEALSKAQDRAEALAKETARLERTLGERTSELGRSRAHIRRLAQANLKLEAQGLAHLREAMDHAETAETLGLQLAAKSTDVAAAWGAARALSAGAEETLGRLEERIRAQAETIQAMEAELAVRSDRIQDMERSQDRLALLFWTIARESGREPVRRSLAALPLAPAARAAAGIASAAVSASRRLRSENLGRVARKGLYSLILAGGLVFALPNQAAVSTGIPAEKTRPESIARILQEPKIASQPLPSGVVYHPLVQRPFDIDFLPPEERARGYEHVQERISGEIDQLADRLGMSPQEYIQVIQRLATPGQTIELSRLKDHQTALAILKNQFPTIMADFKGREMNPDRTRTLLGLAAKAEPEECLFWDRLYSDFRNLGSDPAAALDMILHNSGRRFQKPEGPPPELAGRLTPLPEFENLSLAGFTRVMTPYFRANIRAYAAWPSFSKENEPDLLTAYAKELAQNMFVASEAFGVPRTLMVSIAHQETYFANVMGDGHQSASPFQIYAPTKPYIIKAMWAKGLKVPKVPERLQEHLALSTYMAAFFMSELMDRSTTSWSSGRPGLCDLDRVALHYNGGEHYPPAVVGKKMRLVQYLERVRDVARQKKDRPRA